MLSNKPSLASRFIDLQKQQCTSAEEGCRRVGTLGSFELLLGLGCHDQSAHRRPRYLLSQVIRNEKALTVCDNRILTNNSDGLGPERGAPVGTSRRRSERCFLLSAARQHSLTK